MKEGLEQLNSESGPVTRQDLWQVKDELATRAGMEDVCALLDTKANICDVNSALGRVDAELAARVPEAGALCDLAGHVQRRTLNFLS